MATVSTTAAKGENSSVKTLVAALLSGNMDVSMDGQDGDGMEPCWFTIFSISRGYGLWAQHTCAAPLCNCTL